MKKLLRFLSDFPVFGSEKNLFLHIEDYLANEFLIRPMLVFSIDQNNNGIKLEKCRSVFGKVDRLQLYSTSLLNEILSQRPEISDALFLKEKVDYSYYYFMNLGIKKNQLYFTIFSSPEEISNEMLTELSYFSRSHLNIINNYQDLLKNQELIHIDDVTGLYNQRKLFKDIQLSVERYHKENDFFCVLFIDIDHFKKVNDNYGHLVGTRLLENVAKDIKSLLRDSDFCYRYGGDEFVIILSNSDGIAGKIVGERILKKIRNKEYPVDFNNLNKLIALSVSIGIAEFPTDAKSSDEILAIADRMMYEAKESGRGLVFNTQDVFKSSLKKLVQHN